MCKCVCDLLLLLMTLLAYDYSSLVFTVFVVIADYLLTGF